MSDEKEPTVNFSINGNVGQAAAKIENNNSHIGDVNNYGSQPPTVEAVFKTLIEAVPEPEQAKMEEEVFTPLRAEIQSLMAMPIAETEKPVQSFIDRATALVQPLAPYADKLGAVALSFGEAGLSMIAPPAGWFVAATLAAIRTLKGSAPSV